MKSVSMRVLAAGLATTVALSTALPLQAAMLVMPPQTLPSPRIINVQGGGGDMSANDSKAGQNIARTGRAVPNRFEGSSRFEGRRFDRSAVQDGFERRGSYAYYNGHRGYRSYRDGYREHNGFWFPLAAFAAGALIAGAARPAPAPVPVATNPHVDWCLRHYRSYNPYDNTFQPYGGPRLVCRSPFG